jgi:hypothetical protein
MGYIIPGLIAFPRQKAEVKTGQTSHKKSGMCLPPTLKAILVWCSIARYQASEC